jgi:hypothetical protein
MNVHVPGQVEGDTCRQSIVSTTISGHRTFKDDDPEQSVRPT